MLHVVFLDAPEKQWINIPVNWTETLCRMKNEATGTDSMMQTERTWQTRNVCRWMWSPSWSVHLIIYWYVFLACQPIQ